MTGEDEELTAHGASGVDKGRSICGPVELSLLFTMD